MRKLFGLLFAVVAMFFLAMAYSQLARAADPTCESVLAAQIAELVKQDKSKILDMQFELTTLKLAYETLSANRTTVESYIRKQETLIAKLDDQETRRQLRELYEKNGKAADFDKIEKQLTQTVARAKSGTYFKKELRFKNSELSAYVVSKQAVDPSGAFDENDAAILWLQSEISEGVANTPGIGRWSAPANLQEASTLVARLTGVAGTTGMPKEEIEQRIAALQTVIGDELDQIATTFTDEQKKACAELAQCDDCAAKGKTPTLSDEHKAAGLGKALRDIGEKLVTDPAARDAAVKKVTAELKKEKPAIERESDGETASDDGWKTKKPKPFGKPPVSKGSAPVAETNAPDSSWTMTGAGIPQWKAPAPPNPTTPTIPKPNADRASRSTDSDSVSVANTADTIPTLPPIIIVKPARDSLRSVADSARTKTPQSPSGPSKKTENGKSRPIKTAGTTLATCTGSMTVSDDARSVHFVVKKGETVVCDATYTVPDERDASVFDETDALIECKRQGANFVEVCKE
jgi:hypothetical protein